MTHEGVERQFLIKDCNFPFSSGREYFDFGKLWHSSKQPDSFHQHLDMLDGHNLDRCPDYFPKRLIQYPRSKIIVTSLLRNHSTYRRHLIVLWCRISYLLCWIGRLIAKLILRIEWTWSWILLCLSVGVGILIGLGLLGRGWTFEEIESNSLFRWLWRGFWFGTVCEIFFIMRKYHTVWSNQTDWNLK